MMLGVIPATPGMVDWALGLTVVVVIVAAVAHAVHMRVLHKRLMAELRKP